MKKRVLVISPHTDDAEVGAGGTLIKYEDEIDVLHIALSDCQDIERNLKYNLKHEFNDANDFLKVNSEILNFPNRRFSEKSFEIRGEFERFKRLFNPEIILCPASCDIHQDHQVVYAEAFRVFRNNTILGYSNPRSSMGFRPNLYIELNRGEVDRKCELVAFYVSQMKEYYMQKDVILANLMSRGAEIGKQYAEGFEIIRMVVP